MDHQMDDVPLLLDNDELDLEALLIEEGSLPPLSSSSSPKSSQSSIEESMTFRPLQPCDRHEIQALHEEWFPVKYEDEFYDDLVKNRMFNSGAPLFSRVAIHHSIQQQSPQPLTSDDKHNNSNQESENGDQIAACVVGSFLNASRVHKETRQALIRNPYKHSRLFYIMTLGTVTEFRHGGLGSAMVQQCCQEVEKDPQCGALYLHVITFNEPAIRFYEKLGFSRVLELHDYYTIDGKNYNCYLYAKYFNGNRGHKSIFNFVSRMLSVVWDRVLSPVSLLQEIVGGFDDGDTQ